jgi:hypothetical protein
MGNNFSKAKIENFYNNAKIYKIVSNHTDDVYYGSTCNTLSRRIYQHRADYKRWIKKTYGYTSSFEIMKFDDCQIFLVEEICCETKDQLIARERYHIENNVCVNKFIPGRKNKEWKAENYTKYTCECGSILTNYNKAPHERSKKHLIYLSTISEKMEL